MEERGGASGMAYVGGLGNVAKVLLMLLNMAFMVAGCLLVYFSHRVKTSGWLDAFQGDYEWIGTSTLILTLVLGAVVIALSALGCFGALMQQKLLLTIYGIVLLLTAILFVVVAVGAHMANSKADDWNSKDYPATDNEASLGTNFNKLYCYAQVPYYCEDASVNTVLAMFNTSLAGYFSDSTTNFTNVCSTVTLAAINDICAVCDLISQYDEYSVVLDWTESSCPRTSANQIWCGGFLLNATAADDMSMSAPFMECRSVFYELVEKWTNVIMIASIICIIAAVMVLAMTGVLWKNVRAARQEKAMLPAPAPAPMYPFAADQNTGYSQRSEAPNSNNFSMHSNAPYNPNAAHRRYDSPY
ncbi:hypothetical protein PI124_g8569 [Phytophthora idaei]|nr:hypothetical protein PI125_g8398 [Phytophthora idaei]KAG3158685.1 hypothetical protein PI126_g7738 [Phytophthora idaei]KAG3246733.1 hypothetical protein PI124_g8569 [Phytophthora idaei]